jgi:hypothetical protein
MSNKDLFNCLPLSPGGQWSRAPGLKPVPKKQKPCFGAIVNMDRNANLDWPNALNRPPCLSIRFLRCWIVFSATDDRHGYAAFGQCCFNHEPTVPAKALAEFEQIAKVIDLKWLITGRSKATA